jgi:hypothetical protein
MENPRFEKHNERRDELSGLLNGLSPDDPQREELQALLVTNDRINQRSLVKAAKPRRQRTVPTIEADSSVLTATARKGKNAQIRIYTKTGNRRQEIDMQGECAVQGREDHRPARASRSLRESWAQCSEGSRSRSNTSRKAKAERGSIWG